MRRVSDFLYFKMQSISTSCRQGVFEKPTESSGGPNKVDYGATKYERNATDELLVTAQTVRNEILAAARRAPCVYQKSVC